MKKCRLERAMWYAEYVGESQFYKINVSEVQEKSRNGRSS